MKSKKKINKLVLNRKFREEIDQIFRVDKIENQKKENDSHGLEVKRNSND